MKRRVRNGSGKDKDNKSGEKTDAAFSISREPVVHGKADEENAHKFDLTVEPGGEPPLPTPEYENLGELPESYGSKTVYLVARDPHWLFVYWDVDWAPYSETLRKLIHLRLYSADGSEELDIHVDPFAKNWYIPVKRTGVSYYVELGYWGGKGEWNMIGRSEPASTPADFLSPDTFQQFATVPFHLTFHRLLDTVKSAMGEGDSLIQTLSRLQREGRLMAFAPGEVPGWSEEQRRVIEMILGADLIDKSGRSSGDIDVMLRQQLREMLSSESASGLAGRVPAPAYGESSLFSGISSWSAASWGAAESSLFSAAGLWQSLISSLFSGALFSGVGASWSAQPFSLRQERGFFMHVNAEVIFYGGTHPDAKVTIDGKPIKLNPDGSFRYHFVFPDKAYEIPIVAESPDGVETRSATLSFTRSTARAGDVGATGQPEDLDEPMGGNE